MQLTIMAPPSTGDLITGVDDEESNDAMLNRLR